MKRNKNNIADVIDDSATLTEHMCDWTTAISVLVLAAIYIEYCCSVYTSLCTYSLRFQYGMVWFNV